VTPAARHLAALAEAVDRFGRHLPVVEAWGTRLAGDLSAGRRLLAAGNGGSAAEAQHLTSELVGRYRQDRRPFDALALHAEGSAITAIGNDYGFDEIFARQVSAHGRRGDHLVLLSTSGRSPNLVKAVAAARASGLCVWALTGPRPNPLAGVADEVVAVPSRDPAVVQELHLVAVHLLCEALDGSLADMAAGPPGRRARAAAGLAAVGTGGA
jgi:D-sedoheptulose 7-phosphate isomerase